jgi:hypothetical protein
MYRAAHMREHRQAAWLTPATCQRAVETRSASSGRVPCPDPDNAARRGKARAEIRAAMRARVFEWVPDENPSVLHKSWRKSCAIRSGKKTEMLSSGVIGSTGNESSGKEIATSKNLQKSASRISFKPALYIEGQFFRC